MLVDYNAGSTFRSCTTVNGICTTAELSLHKKNGTAIYTVQSISPDPSLQDNHDPDGDSDGTVIVISKP